MDLQPTQCDTSAFELLLKVSAISLRATGVLLKKHGEFEELKRASCFLEPSNCNKTQPTSTKFGENVSAEVSIHPTSHQYAGSCNLPSRATGRRARGGSPQSAIWVEKWREGTCSFQSLHNVVVLLQPSIVHPARFSPPVRLVDIDTHVDRPDALLGVTLNLGHDVLAW